MTRKQIGNLYWRDRKNGVVELKVHVGTTPAGKRVWRHKTVRAKNEREARVALAQFVADVFEDGPALSSPGTVGWIIDRFIETCETANHSPTTVEGYRSIARTMKARIGGIDALVFTARHMNDYLTWLHSNGKSAGTRLNHRRFLHRAFEVAIDEDRVPANPVRKATKPKPNRVPITAPRSDVVEQVLVKAALSRNPDLAVAIAIDLAVGGRRGETLALRRTDLEGNRLTIARSLVQPGGKGPYVIKDTKAHQIRVVELTPEGLRLIHEHIARCEERAKAAGTSLRADAYLLCDQREVADGSIPWRPNRLTQAFGRFRDALGENIRLHDLRHHVASQMAKRGHGTPAIARQLGNRPETTAKHYAHFVDDGSDRIVHALASTVDGVVGLVADLANEPTPGTA